MCGGSALGDFATRKTREGAARLSSVEPRVGGLFPLDSARPRVTTCAAFNLTIRPATAERIPHGDNFDC